MSEYIAMKIRDGDEATQFLHHGLQKQNCFKSQASYLHNVPPVDEMAVRERAQEMVTMASPPLITP
jgi:hypothetical protein